MYYLEEVMLTRKFETCQDCGVELRTEEEKGIQVLILKGEMVTGEGDVRLREEVERLFNEGCLRIVVDFSQVPYIDSSVLGQLVYGYSLMRENGGNLKILSPSPRIKDLLDVTRLATVFDIFTDRTEAVESWSSES